MKNRIILGACLAVSALIAFAAPRIAEKTAAKPDPVSSEVSLTDGYLLREYDGMIGVFEVGKSEPLDVIKVDLRTLPESDRNALIRGIYAADDEELSRRIEDFSS